MRRAASYISISLATLFTSAIVVGVGAQGRGGADVSLPEGPGRELVQGTCARCHGLNMIASSWGNDQDGWRQLFGSMVALPREQADTISAYLAKNFPPRPAPEAVVIAGPGERVVQGVARADPRVASARSARRRRRLDLVDRPVRQSSWPARSRDRPDEGVSADEAADRGRTDSSRTRRATSGSPRIRAHTSASSIQRPGRSPSTRCRKVPVARTRRSSIRRARCSSPLQSGQVGRIDPATGDDEAGRDADGEQLSVRHPGQLEGRAVVRGFPRQPRRQRRPGHDGDQGAHAAGRERTAAAHRAHAGRRGLVHRLRARLPRTVRSRDRRGEGMAVAWRRAVAAVRHRRHGRRDLVQRIGRPSEHARALRSTRPRSSRPGSSRLEEVSCAT